MRQVFDEAEIELSPLSGEVARDGRKVFVEIYRSNNRPREWTLEVRGDEDISTIWQKAFASDRDALQAFEDAVTAFSIAAFSNESSAAEN